MCSPSKPYNGIVGSFKPPVDAPECCGRGICLAITFASFQPEIQCAGAIGSAHEDKAALLEGWTI